jgi:hypothetical protein
MIAFAFLATCSSRQPAVLCLDLEMIDQQRFSELRTIASAVAVALKGEHVDRSSEDNGKLNIRVQIDKNDARMTIQSFASDQPLLCVDGKAGDPDVHRLIEIAVERLQQSGIGYGFGNRGALDSLPAALKAKVLKGIREVPSPRSRNATANDSDQKAAATMRDRLPIDDTAARGRENPGK